MGGAHQLLAARRSPSSSRGRLVGEQEPAVRCLGGHRVGDAAEDRLQLLARLRALLLVPERLDEVADLQAERLGQRVHAGVALAHLA